MSRLSPNGCRLEAMINERLARGRASPSNVETFLINHRGILPYPSQEDRTILVERFQRAGWDNVEFIEVKQRRGWRVWASPVLGQVRLLSPTKCAVST